MRQTYSAYYFASLPPCSVSSGILNRQLYLLSLLTRPDCIVLGDAFLQSAKCALVLFLTAVGLLQLLGEGPTPSFQLINTSM